MVNVLVYLLEHLSFGLRCPSFLLSKFASQLRLIQSAVWVWILGICVTSSILWLLFLGFWVSGWQVPSFREPIPGSWVSGCHVPGSISSVLGVRFPYPRVPDPRVLSSRSQAPESRVSGLGSQVSGPDFRLCLRNTFYSGFYLWI